MSRPVTPASAITATTGPAVAPGNSKPASHIGQDTIGIDHANQTPEYVATEDAGREGAPQMQRSNSQMSQSATYIPSRGGTLKKKASLHKTGSLKRSGSRRSSYAGSVRSVRLGEKDKYEPEEYNSAFYCPVPTTSNPTEILANRFQAWRRVLKDLINYFRELHKSYDIRSKTLLSASNILNNTAMPSDFLSHGGISEAAEILRDHHKQTMNEAQKSRDLENEVVLQLTGLRSDLSQKIKEIKSLSGDFKNSVHKEQDGTRKAINHFQEALGLVDQDAATAAGKGDPFLMKLGVERQLERQLEEENYLHRAFLNLEISGRELESIVVGEIQKAYNVLAGILKREADGSYDAAEKLREGPLAMARDHEWDAFVTGNSNMVDPQQPLRQVQNITYEGKNHPAAIEVKSGMLERKSKYLKNYTPGWYILSPTHLHEFKSADQIPFQTPVMSLYLPEQKLGSHSEPDSNSHKFMLKGRQTGSMHRGHTWIFRAETHDTMMTWFNDIKELTERKGEARNEFIRRTHARSASGSSNRAPSVASGESQMAEDEADKIAFSGEQSIRGLSVGHENQVYGTDGTAGSGAVGDDLRSDAGWRPQRPQPGGRFPSDVNVTRGLQEPLSPSSGDSGDDNDREILAAASALPGSAIPFVAEPSTQPHTDLQQPTTRDEIGTITQPTNLGTNYTAGEHSRITAHPTGAEVAPDTQSQYHEWVGTAGAGLAGAGAGALGATAVNQHVNSRLLTENRREELSPANPVIPAEGYSSTPITTAAAVPIRANANTLDEHRGITASAYQAATVSHPTEPIGVGSSLVSNQAAGANGNLIHGTDIRAPSATGAPLETSALSSLIDTSTTTRPEAMHTKSLQTISDLHIPGEFPKSATASTSPA